MRGFITFMKGVMRAPVPVRLWLVVLMVVNGIVPLLYLGRIEARVVLGTFLVAAILMFLLTGRFGFTRILGLGHFPWFALIAYLVTRLGEIPADDFFGLWIRAVMVLNGISLLLDVADVMRYARGERAPMVEGL